MKMLRTNGYRAIVRLGNDKLRAYFEGNNSE